MSKFVDISALPRKQLSDLADWLAVALAASIPLSTSATSILAVLWLIAVIPTLAATQFLDELAKPRSALPILLLAFGILGMAWSDVALRDRIAGLDSFAKLLAIPFLVIQFRMSSRGSLVLAAYLAACVVALLCSVFMIIYPDLYWRQPHEYPTLFKNPATQSSEFVSCVAVLLFAAIDRCRVRSFGPLVASAALCAAFIGTIVFSATARTPLVVVPFLLLLLAFRKFTVRGALVFSCGGFILCAALFYASPYLQNRINSIWTEVQSYKTSMLPKSSDASIGATSSGERLEFWKKSFAIVSRAPLFGHGTGSIGEQMKKETEGQSGAYATVTPNPHQQTFAVAIQLGIAGVVILWAMWIVHLAAFRSESFAAWVGTVIVVQNVVGSLFNSHLFDFTQGWTYVVGVGVAAGMVARDQACGRAE